MALISFFCKPFPVHSLNAWGTDFCLNISKILGLKLFFLWTFVSCMTNPVFQTKQSGFWHGLIFLLKCAAVEWN